MKVSIIGAGLSGLSSAFYLEKFGVKPTIYEKKDKVGGHYVTAEAMFGILYKPIVDPYLYFSKTYGLYLKPCNTVNKIIFQGSKHQASIKGFIGFTNLRQDIDVALERQIQRQISSQILFNSQYSYHEILANSDYVIIATGDPSYIEDVTNWKTDVSVELVTANIKGDFEPDEVRIWLNNDIAPKGYGYLLPWDESNASIAIGIPKQEINIEDYWNKFIKQLDFNFEIQNKFDIHSYRIGQPEKNQLGNTLIIGNAGGFLYPFLGFGQFTSIESGMLAAKAILEKKDFNKLIKGMKKDYKRSLALRRKFETLDNNRFNKLVYIMNSNIVKKMYLHPRINVLKMAGELLRFGKK